jgi:hypothetical protein
LLSLETDVNVPKVSNKQETIEKKNYFCWHLESH